MVGTELKSSETESSQLGGPQLLQAVATATGLPEHMAYDELKTILDMNGQSSGEVTLESLRTAMIQYLETLNESMTSED
jgi:hypothetical protein